jgi:hypothetical protein
MEIITSCSLPTPAGSIILALAHGDILEEASKDDIIVASVAGSSYNTAAFPNTLIAGIERKYDFSFPLERERTSFNLLQGLSSWAITHAGKPLILIVEFRDRNKLEATFLDLSLALQILVRKKGIVPNGRVLMPILGAGAQRITVDQIAPRLLEVAVHVFSKLTDINEIVIVDMSLPRIEKVAEIWNKQLGRAQRVFATSDHAKQLSLEILEQFRQVSLIDQKRHAWSDELLAMLENQRISSDVLPALCRKMAESIVSDLWKKIKPDRKFKGLADDIEDLKNCGMAQWILGYLHTLRQFGNFGSHPQIPDSMYPTALEENDLLLCLQCIRAIVPVWRFWVEKSPMNDK